MLCYLGPPVTLAELILDPADGLRTQAHAPRFQRHGAINADGFGAGWYDHARSERPALYRRATPIWSDRSFESVAQLVSSAGIVAAVRNATPPLPVHELNTPPYAAGPWLFAHNGAVDDFTAGAGAALRRLLPEDRLSAIEGSTDSEVLFALVLSALDRGAGPDEALSETIDMVEAISGGRLTMMLTDGYRAAAVAHGGDSLFVRGDDAAATIASEPFGGDEAWERVHDRSVVVAAPGTLRMRPLVRDASREPA